MRLLSGRSGRHHNSRRRGGGGGQEFRNVLLTTVQPLRSQFPQIIPAPPVPLSLPASTTFSLSSSSSTMFASMSPVATAAAAALSSISAVTDPVADAVTSVAASTTAATGVSFWRFLMIFTAGGFFFSTALATAVAFYTFGVDNIKRFTQLGLLILSKVWDSFVLSLSLARQTLLGIDEELKLKGDGLDASHTVAAPKPPSSLPSDIVLKQEQQQLKEHPSGRKKWKWKDAWAVLKEQLSETRKTVNEGVQALKQESTLYAAAVGQPGLLPIQYGVQRLMPYSIATILEDSLKQALRDVEPTKTIKRMKLNYFTAGKRSPVFQGARLYEIENGMAFDFDVKWESELEAEIQIYTVGGFKLLPVSIKKLKFQGVVRVILTPLMKEPPGYGAILVSLTSPPDLSLDVQVLGTELTKFRFLKSEINQLIQKGIAENLLWPRRNVIPVESNSPVNVGPFGNSMGKGHLLSREQLKMLESSDPLLDIEKSLANADSELVRDINEKRKQLDQLSERAITINEEDEDSVKNVTDTTTTEKDGVLSRNDGAHSIDDRVKTTKVWWNYPFTA